MLSLISFCLASVALALSPGPENIYVLTQSLVNGKTSGIAVTVGLVCGCLVHTTLVAFGISAIIASSTTALLLIKIAGASYLLYRLAHNISGDLKCANFSVKV